MEQSDLLNAHVQEKKVYNLLVEVMDLSQQLAEAVDRQDQVTVQLILSMRQDAINRLAETDQVLRTLGEGLSAGDAERLNQLLNGDPAFTQAEQGLANQIADNRRLLQKIIQLDRQINQKIAGSDSFYFTSESAQRK